jgi:hypothetical protein
MDRVNRIAAQIGLEERYIWVMNPLDAEDSLEELIKMGVIMDSYCPRGKMYKIRKVDFFPAFPDPVWSKDE